MKHGWNTDQKANWRILVSTLAILGLTSLFVFLLQTIFYWIGAKLVRAEGAAFGRAVLVSLAVSLIGISIAFLTLSWSDDARPNAARTALLSLALPIATIPLQVFSIKALFRTTLLRGVLVWCMGIPAGAIAIVAVSVFVKPFLVEAFVIQSNAMAPSLVGVRLETKCPHCGGVAIVSVPAPEQIVQGAFDDRAQRGQCLACGQSERPPDEPSPVLVPDKIIVNKTLSPRRWDVIEFRFPPDPSVKYVKRLVGLPGEVVFIKDGAVWVNGEKQELPKEIGTWTYTNGLDVDHKFPMGSPEHPWHLKADEVCVLGDFSLRSSDSREWGPVPFANIEGVVGMRYWPPARWQIWR